MPDPRPPTVTVVGGGLAGLVTAVECAEAGVSVRLVESRTRLGGRATSTPGPYVANLGPHALYAGTELWDWLRRRGLHGPAPMPRSPRITLRWRGSARRVPPRALLPVLRWRGVGTPVDRDLRGWLTDGWGPDTASAVAGLAGPLTFDHDPGRLSARFVVERIQRILLRPLPSARCVAGGWSALVDRLAAHARNVGVDVQTGSPVTAEDLPDLARPGPIVVAVEPGAARRLLGDGVTAGSGGAPAERRRVALLDVGVERSRRDPYLIVDLDEAIFSTRPSAVVGGLAPAVASSCSSAGAWRPERRSMRPRPGSSRCSTPPSPAGGSGSTGGGGRACGRRRAPSTCPARRGTTVRPSTGATACGSPATGCGPGSPGRGEPDERQSLAARGGRGRARPAPAPRPRTYPTPAHRPAAASQAGG